MSVVLYACCTGRLSSDTACSCALVGASRADARADSVRSGCVVTTEAIDPSLPRPPDPEVEGVPSVDMADVGHAGLLNMAIAGDLPGGVGVAEQEDLPVRFSGLVAGACTVWVPVLGVSAYPLWSLVITGSSIVKVTSRRIASKICR